MSVVLKQARTEVNKQARIRRHEKAVELQMALEDRAAARRLLQELAEMERDAIRWAARLRIRVRPDPPARRTSDVVKRSTIPRRSQRLIALARAPSSWATDDLGMRGVIWQQTYLGRKSPGFHRGAARANWEYEVRDEAVLLGAGGEPVILSNMGDDWIEIGAAWQAIEDASTRANAKIQIRVIAPFDADASEDEMIAALGLFCRTVLEPLDLPYSAVIHKPPEAGDQRNFHPHLSFSLRPMRRVEPYCWEVADEVRGELDGRDGVQMLRHLWAHTMSEAAERAGSNRRYTGLSYGARGLPFEAGEHLGESRSAMVRRGEQVWAHERNRIRTARNAARRTIRDADHKIAALAKVRDAALAQQSAEQSGTQAVRRLVPSHTVDRVRIRRASTAAVTKPAPDLARIASQSLDVSTPPMRRVASAAATTVAARVHQVSRAAPPSELRSASKLPLPSPSRRVSASMLQSRAPVLTYTSQTEPAATLLRASQLRRPPEPHIASTSTPTPSAPHRSAAVEPSSAFPASRPCRRVAQTERPPAPLLAASTQPPTPMPDWMTSLHQAARDAARTKADKAAKTARARACAADPDWIAPFDAEGFPSEALRDVLLAVARARGTVKVAADGAIDTDRASEPVRELLRLWRDDEVAPMVRATVERGGVTGRERWPEHIADLMEAHDRRRSAQASASRTASSTRPAPMWDRRHQPWPERIDPRRGRLPTIAEVASRSSLEAHPRRAFGVEEWTLAAADRGRLARLRQIDAYVGDSGGELLEIDAPAMNAVGATADWLARRDIQRELETLRAAQQRVMNAMAEAAARRPLAFSKAGTRFWPRDLDAEHLRRLDRWVPDIGFQHDVARIENVVRKAHAERDAASARRANEPDRERTGDMGKPIPDGFGGERNTPPPTYRGDAAGARLKPFDAAGRPTEPLLRLLDLAARHPRAIAIATDGRPMVEGKAPALLAPLLHGWRHNEQVVPLVIETMRLSRAAGRPTWPPKVEAAVRAFSVRDVGYGANAPRSDPTRSNER